MCFLFQKRFATASTRPPRQRPGIVMSYLHHSALSSRWRYGDTHSSLSPSQVLIEASQRLPDGRVRQRGLPLSEKMIGHEGWRDAALRAVAEELDTALRSEPDWRSQVQSMQPVKPVSCAWFLTTCSTH